MERKFNVGDRVRIIRSLYEERIGVTATVIDLRSWNPIPDGAPHKGIVADGTEMCVLDLAPLVRTTNVVAYPHDWLAPYYDGNERVAWSTCIWQPKQVRA